MKTELFWNTIRSGLFRGKMTQGAVDTVNAIVDCYYAYYLTTGNQNHLAYILATAYHESYHHTLNPEWNPVREGFAKTNFGAIRAVTMMYESGRIKTNYALPHTNGLSYYGRGFVQVTWPDNYKRVGDLIGEDLYNNPDLLIESIDVSAKALVIGSMEGVYTGRKVSDYTLPDGSFDAFSARRVVNGLDKADKIKKDYEIFNFALSNAVAS